jgi:hypothetical protein
LDHDYCFAVFDGLNRYYVRREDERLVPIISLAPNSFDQFIPYVYQRQIEDLQVRYWPRRIATTATRSIDRVTRAIGRTVRSIASAK